MERKKFKIDDYNKREPFKDATKFFVVYEGEKELNYFQLFNYLFLPPEKASIIHVLEKDTIVGSQPKKLIERADFFIKNPPKDISVTPSEDDKFRFVLDVDQHPADQFNELYEYCNKLNDANLYISNICFEVWLYFHLDKREKILSNSSSEMKTELGAKHTELKIKNYPRGYLTSERIKKAIEEAENADNDKTNFFPIKNSSKVYLLMQELLKHSILNEDVNNPETL
ncbi:MAG: RloB family protein [Flavobacterium sp.]|uniref:RloB family protein n=1 Tax=Flavobacterium sp. TaxID=239 RepID=UPI002B4742E8|nr:RloB family protein [Flavobacterium sp.]WRH72287.1 MAG: RloB family protein [Flavobacterium sp.]